MITKLFLTGYLRGNKVHEYISSPLGISNEELGAKIKGFATAFKGCSFRVE